MKPRSTPCSRKHRAVRRDHSRGFSRKLLRGEKPDLLLEADATDPTAVGYAIAAMNA